MTDYEKMVEDHILTVILALIWLTFLWTFYLSLRQKSFMERLVDVPSSIEALMTKSVYDKSRNYSLDKLIFSNFDNLYSLIFSTIFLLTFSYRRLWDYSINTAKYFGIDHENEMYLSMIFMFLMNVVFNIVGLPLKVYKIFVLEEKYNFNKQKPWFFVKDQLLHFAVVQVIASPVISGMIWIIKNGGDYFFFYLWIFGIVVTLFLVIIYPEVIAPLFDKYRPLPEGDLKRKIEELAASVEFPLYKLFVVEGSKRSSHSNAYLYGFHKNKRIVLFDTLVKEYYKQVVQEEKKEENVNPKSVSKDQTEAQPLSSIKEQETNEESELLLSNTSGEEGSGEKSVAQTTNTPSINKSEEQSEMQVSDTPQEDEVQSESIEKASEKKVPEDESEKDVEKSQKDNAKEETEEVIGCETEEVLAVLAHEIGHWKYSHALKGFIFTQINVLVNNLLYAKLLDYTPMYRAFGFVDSKPVFIGLTIITMYLLIPLTMVMRFISVVMSRRFEFQADRFATELGHGEHLKKALVKLQKDNLGYPLFDKLYSSWHHTHPPLLERLEAIGKHE